MSRRPSESGGPPPTDRLKAVLAAGIAQRQVADVSGGSNAAATSPSPPQREPVPQVSNLDKAKKAGWAGLAVANNFLFRYIEEVTTRVKELKQGGVNSDQSVKEAHWYMSRVYLYPGFVDAVKKYKTNQGALDPLLGWIQEQVRREGDALTKEWKTESWSQRTREKFSDFKAEVKDPNDGDGGSDAEILERFLVNQITYAIQWIKEKDILLICPCAA